MLRPGADQSLQSQPSKPRDLNNGILNDLAEKLGNKWTTLAIHLEIDYSKVENYETNYPRSQERQAFVMLKEWRDEYVQPNDTGSSGAADVLCAALKKTGRNDLVKRLRAALKAPHNADALNAPRNADDVDASQNADGLPEVVPDSGGSYADHKMKKARPTQDMQDPENTYQLMSKCKGLAFILNNSDFNRGQRREGSQIDTANMKHLFEGLGYTTILRENLKGKDITKYFKKFASMFNQEGKSYDSAVIALMSHGNTGVILGTDNVPVKLRDLQRELEPRQCPGLDKKPKMYFVQACRGNFVTTLPVNHESGAQESNQRHEEVVPVQSDFVTETEDLVDVHFAYSTTDGYLSLRSEVSGSFFVQALCEVFFDRAHLDNLDTLMNKVTDRVDRMKGKLYDYESKQSVVVKQTVECVKRMRKAVYFLPNYP